MVGGHLIVEMLLDGYIGASFLFFDAPSITTFLSFWGGCSLSWLCTAMNCALPSFNLMFLSSATHLLARGFRSYNCE